jgi:hypothetical protein
MGTVFAGAGNRGWPIRQSSPDRGQRAFDAIQGTLEGTVSSMEYSFPEVGKPAVKQSLETRVGNQGCGVSFYK